MQLIDWQERILLPYFVELVFYNYQKISSPYFFVVLHIYNILSTPINSHDTEIKCINCFIS